MDLKLLLFSKSVIFIFNCGHKRENKTKCLTLKLLRQFDGRVFESHVVYRVFPLRPAENTFTVNKPRAGIYRCLQIQLQLRGLEWDYWCNSIFLKLKCRWLILQKESDLYMFTFHEECTKTNNKPMLTKPGKHQQKSNLWLENSPENFNYSTISCDQFYLSWGVCFPEWTVATTATLFSTKTFKHKNINSKGKLNQFWRLNTAHLLLYLRNILNIPTTQLQ